MQHPEAAEDAQEPRSSGAKKKRKGHGIPISREQKGDLIYQLAHGASLRQAAAVVQCHYSTVSRLLNHDPQFAASVARCQEFVAIEAFKNIRAAGRKEWKAAVWLLEYLERRSQRLQATERAQGDEA